MGRGPGGGASRRTFQGPDRPRGFQLLCPPCLSPVLWGMSETGAGRLLRARPVGRLPAQAGITRGPPLPVMRVRGLWLGSRLLLRTQSSAKN